MVVQHKQMDIQKWKDHCLNGELVEILLRVRSERLPIGRINVNQVRANGNITNHVATHFPVRSPRKRLFALQIALREGCGYGHYALALVNGVDFYVFDPDGRPGTFLPVIREVCKEYGFRYAGSLSVYLDIRMPRYHNRGHDCALWVAFVYHLLATRRARRVLSLPLRTQRTMMQEFVSSVS